jgi:hypothetical protein
MLSSECWVHASCARKVGSLVWAMDDNLDRALRVEAGAAVTAVEGASQRAPVSVCSVLSVAREGSRLALKQVT